MELIFERTTIFHQFSYGKTKGNRTLRDEREKDLLVGKLP